jgi:hypothetical protein
MSPILPCSGATAPILNNNSTRTALKYSLDPHRVQVVRPALRKKWNPIRAFRNSGSSATHIQRSPIASTTTTKSPCIALLLLSPRFTRTNSYFILNDIDITKCIPTPPPRGNGMLPTGTLFCKIGCIVQQRKIKMSNTA